MSLVSKQPDLIQYVLDFAMSTAAYDPERFDTNGYLLLAKNLLYT